MSNPIDIINAVILSKTQPIMERFVPTILKLDSVVASYNSRLQELRVTEGRIDEEFSRGKRSIDEQLSKSIIAIDDDLTKKARAIDEQIEAIERNYLGDNISVKELINRCHTIIMNNGNPKEYITADEKYMFSSSYDNTENAKEKRLAEFIAIKKRYIRMISDDDDVVLIMKYLLKNGLTQYSIKETLKTECDKLADKYFNEIPKSDIYRAADLRTSLQHRHKLGQIEGDECFKGTLEAEYKRDTSSDAGIRYSIAFRLPNIINPVIEFIEKAINEQKNKKYSIHD
ncbi:MAG: hypothetical protein LBU65_08960 [Planctomycetaceae bacterium]|jgi:hypothetical protein|nr:hypothetical protein [Planctomycetaceae bacterium]